MGELQRTSSLEPPRCPFVGDCAVVAFCAAASALPPSSNCSISSIASGRDGLEKVRTRGTASLKALVYSCYLEQDTFQIKCSTPVFADGNRQRAALERRRGGRPRSKMSNLLFSTPPTTSSTPPWQPTHVQKADRMKCELEIQSRQPLWCLLIPFAYCALFYELATS